MRKIAVFLLAAACGGTSTSNASSSQALSQRATLAGNSPSWATATNLKSAAAATDWVGVRVYLGWQTAAQANGDAVAGVGERIGGNLPHAAKPTGGKDDCLGVENV